MKEFIQANWQFILTNLITISIVLLGFYQSRKAFKNEILKIQKQRSIEKMDKAFRFATEILIKPEKAASEMVVDEYNDFLADILTYCSKESIRIFAQYQQCVFHDEYTGITLVAFFSILISQLKHDVTGEWTSPELIMKMKIKDYNTLETDYKKTVNELVRKYRFNEKLLIDS